MEKAKVDEWVEYKLEDVIESVNTGLDAIKRAPIVENDTGIKCLRIQDISQEKKYENWGFCKVSNKNFERFQLKKDDIIIARTGATVGVNLIIKENLSSVYNNGLIRIRANKDICDPTYLNYQLKTHKYWGHIEGVALSTSTQPNMRIDGLLDFKFELPPLEKQMEVASILSTFDDLIENNTRRIEILEEMARRIYREWFVHFRYPGHEEDQLVDSGTELGEIPEGWNVKKLEDLCELTLGQSPKSEFYNDKGEGLPFHQGVKDFGDRYPTTTTWCSKIKRVAEEGDILFSVRAPVGRINIANTKMIIGRGLHSIRSKSDNQVFIYRQLKDKFQEEDVMGSGTIYKSVTKKDMLNLKLIDPGQEMNDKFEDIVVPIFKQIKTLTEKNIKLKESRDLLLPKLISGEIEVESGPLVKK